jgi:hypothetical protein
MKHVNDKVDVSTISGVMDIFEIDSPTLYAE